MVGPDGRGQTDRGWTLIKEPVVELYPTHPVPIRSVRRSKGRRPEGRVVAKVEEQMAFYRLAVDENRPAASADLGAVVCSLPGELDTGPAVPFGRAAVQPPLDGDESELAGPVPGELDESRFH
jgi:hypothetical protein